MELEFREFDIQGLIYKINQEGKIINSDNKEIKQRLNVDGYCVVTLGRNKKRKTYRVHRLVALAFIPNPLNLEDVNHKDFNRENSNVDNLEWVSHTDNIEYTVKAGRHVSSRDLYKENNPNYKNDTLKKYYEENPEEKLKLARKGKQNGRAKKISVYSNDNIHIQTFDYIGELAKWLIENEYTKTTEKTIRNNIAKSVEESKLYLGFILKFE